MNCLTLRQLCLGQGSIHLQMGKHAGSLRLESQRWINFSMSKVPSTSKTGPAHPTAFLKSLLRSSFGVIHVSPDFCRGGGGEEQSAGGSLAGHLCGCQGLDEFQDFPCTGRTRVDSVRLPMFAAFLVFGASSEGCGSHSFGTSSSSAPWTYHHPERAQTNSTFHKVRTSLHRV